MDYVPDSVPVPLDSLPKSMRVWKGLALCPVCGKQKRVDLYKDPHSGLVACGRCLAGNVKSRGGNYFRAKNKQLPVSAETIEQICRMLEGMSTGFLN